MFDKQAGGPDAATTLSLVARARRLVLGLECQQLELAAHWADLHHPDSQVPAEKTPLGAEQGRQLGGEGTPEVLEFAASELGARMETSYGSARALMADALDIRHRLPQLWQLIVAGCVPSWRARKVAQATRHLSRDAAMHVDAAVAGCIATLPWGGSKPCWPPRSSKPPAGRRGAVQDLGGGTVRAGRPQRTIRVEVVDRQANAGDVIWFMATVNRIAEILRLQGDLESADVRRSKAIGILAQPAVALQLLWEFRNEQHPAGQPQQPDERIDNEVNPPFDDSTESPAADPPDTTSDHTVSDATLPVRSGSRLAAASRNQPHDLKRRRQLTVTSRSRLAAG